MPPKKAAAAKPEAGQSKAPGRRTRGAPAPDAAEQHDTPELERAVSVKIDMELWERAQNAFWHTRARAGEGGYATWKQWIATAIELLTEHQERMYNNGKPFPQRPVDQLPRGRVPGNQ